MAPPTLAQSNGAFDSRGTDVPSWKSSDERSLSFKGYLIDASWSDYDLVSLGRAMGLRGSFYSHGDGKFHHSCPERSGHAARSFLGSAGADGFLGSHSRGNCGKLVRLRYFLL